MYLYKYIYRRTNGIYIQKSCSIWTICPCLILYKLISFLISLYTYNIHLYTNQICRPFLPPSRHQKSQNHIIYYFHFFKLKLFDLI